MLGSTLYVLLRNLLLVLLCLTFVFVPCIGVSTLTCLEGSNGWVSHPALRHHVIDKNDPSFVTMAVATKAHLSPVVFHGTLLSVLVQRDGTVRASFGVNRLLKWGSSAAGIGELDVAFLQRLRTGEECVLHVNEENMKLGSQYVIFGRRVEGTLTSISATAFPIPYEKKIYRTIKKVVCKGCAKSPGIAGLKGVRIKEKETLRLQCHISGNPIPWVEWYKDGLRVDGRGRIRVKTKRRTSRLIIRQSRRQDRGVYECKAANVVQETPVSAKAIVAIAKLIPKTTLKPTLPVITTTVTAGSSLWPTEPCPSSEFCLNGGTCIFYRDVWEYVCHCAEGYVGLRCHYKDVSLSVSEVRSDDRRTNRLFVVVVVLFVILSCINWSSFLVCWFCCFRKETSLKRIRQMEPLNRLFKNKNEKNHAQSEVVENSLE